MVVISDPTGEIHGIPTYHWRDAPDGFATRRQLNAMGLRIGGQPPAAQVRRRGALIAFLYRVDLAAPKFELTLPKLKAVWTAALSRYRCSTCDRRLPYIPRQAEPAYGRCWTCVGLPAEDVAGEPECPCCHDEAVIACPACNGTGGGCSMCAGDEIIACPACGGI